MKRLATITLPGAGALYPLGVGTLLMGMGRVAQAIRLVFTFALANGSGASVTLTDAQKQTLLSGYKLSLSYGKGGRFKPWKSADFRKVQRAYRFFAGTEWEGYSDSTTGLARALPSGATTTCQLHVTIPTGRIWQLAKQRRVWGLGPTQARDVELSVLREADLLPAGVTVSGNVTATVYLDEVPKPGPEQFWVLPEYSEVTNTTRGQDSPRGLVWRWSELSAAHAATALTDVHLNVPGVGRLHENVSLVTVRQAGALDLPGFPAEADVSDRETLVVETLPDAELSEVPTGAYRLEQATHTLNPATYAFTVSPILTEQEVAEEVQNLAGATGRNQPLKAVSALVVDGSMKGVDARLQPYVPWYLYTQEDGGYQAYPGLWSDGRAPGEVYVPETVAASAQGLYRQYLGAGEPLSALGVLSELASAVPGSVQAEDGFRTRTSIFYKQLEGRVA